MHVRHGCPLTCRCLPLSLRFWSFLRVWHPHTPARNTGSPLRAERHAVRSCACGTTTLMQENVTHGKSLFIAVERVHTVRMHGWANPSPVFCSCLPLRHISLLNVALPLLHSSTFKLCHICLWPFLYLNSSSNDLKDCFNWLLRSASAHVSGVYTGHINILNLFFHCLVFSTSHRRDWKISLGEIIKFGIKLMWKTIKEIFHV